MRNQKKGKEETKSEKFIHPSTNTESTESLEGAPYVERKMKETLETIEEDNSTD